MKAVERGEVDKVAAVLGKKGIIPTKLDVEGRSAWVISRTHSDVPPINTRTPTMHLKYGERSSRDTSIVLFYHFHDRTSPKCWTHQIPNPEAVSLLHVAHPFLRKVFINANSFSISSLLFRNHFSFYEIKSRSPWLILRMTSCPPKHFFTVFHFAVLKHHIFSYNSVLVLSLFMEGTVRLGSQYKECLWLDHVGHGLLTLSPQEMTPCKFRSDPLWFLQHEGIHFGPA